MTDNEIDNFLIQPMILNEESKTRKRVKAQRFVFSYLIKKGGKGKVYRLLLKHNGFKPYINLFLSDIEFYIDSKLIKVLKKSKRSLKLELTLSGKMVYLHTTKAEVKIPSYFLRVKVFLVSLTKVIWEFIYITINNYLLRFFKSGWSILILSILAFFYFYLPYKLSINKQNNKLNVPPTIELLQNQKLSKKPLELLVYIKDSLPLKKDTLTKK